MEYVHRRTSPAVRQLQPTAIGRAPVSAAPVVARFVKLDRNACSRSAHSVHRRYTVHFAARSPRFPVVPSYRRVQLRIIRSPFFDVLQPAVQSRGNSGARQLSARAFSHANSTTSRTIEPFAFFSSTVFSTSPIASFLSWWCFFFHTRRPFIAQCAAPSS